jgi:hypothetical protein
VKALATLLAELRVVLGDPHALRARAKYLVRRKLDVRAGNQSREGSRQELRRFACTVDLELVKVEKEVKA